MSLGDGVESQSLQESPKKSTSIVIPDDFESQKEMVSMVMIVCPHKLLEQVCLEDFTLCSPCVHLAFQYT